MTSYQSFAKFYDQIMGDRKSSAARIQKIVHIYAPHARTLLELGCGTGSVLAHLQKSYTVDGLDLSREMLRIAKKKVSNAPFHHKSMTDFKINKRFDVIICVFDSINHLSKWSDWKKVFKLAHRHLADGGIFLFDINSQEKLKDFAEKPAWVQKFPGFYLYMNVTCDKRSLSKWEIKIFEQQAKNRYLLHEETILEKAFPIETITCELNELYQKVQPLDKEGRAIKGDVKYFVCSR